MQYNTIQYNTIQYNTIKYDNLIRYLSLSPTSRSILLKAVAWIVYFKQYYENNKEVIQMQSKNNYNKNKTTITSLLALIILFSTVFDASNIPLTMESLISLFIHIFSSS